MIKLIGLQRLIMIAGLLGLNVFLMFIYLVVIDPMRTEAQIQRDSIRGQISSLQSQISNIKNEMLSFQQNLPKYENLKTRGFFLDQDRFRMSRDLGDVRMAAGLSGFSYNINDIEKVPNGEAAAAQLQLINSRVVINNVGLLLDSDLYRFFDLMTEKFPAHTRLQSFRVARIGVLDDAALKGLAGPLPTPVVSAEATFDWMTLVPATPVDPNNPQGAGGQ